MTPSEIAAGQIVDGPGIALDHVAHFVPDMGTAETVLERLGFTLTPFSEQQVKGADGRPAPAGTANRCIMLERGYIEILTTTGETENAGRLKQAMARHVGLHLIAFGVADAEARHRAMATDGFAPQPLVRLERDIGTETGVGRARFTVARPAAGAMPEGRIQFLTHHTPELLWQPRWVRHVNRAVALTDVVIAVADLTEARARFARYLGVAPASLGAEGALYQTRRGRLTLLSAAGFARAMPAIPAPSLPFIAAVGIECADLAAARRCLVASGLPTADRQDALVVAGPPALGGGFAFLSPGAKPPWLGP
jgi:hypothetical protein